MEEVSNSEAEPHASKSFVLNKFIKDPNWIMALTSMFGVLLSLYAVKISNDAISKADQAIKIELLSRREENLDKVSSVYEECFAEVDKLKFELNKNLDTDFDLWKRKNGMKLDGQGCRMEVDDLGKTMVCYRNSFDSFFGFKQKIEVSNKISECFDKIRSESPQFYNRYLKTKHVKLDEIILRAEKWHNDRKTDAAYNILGDPRDVEYEIEDALLNIIDRSTVAVGDAIAKERSEFSTQIYGE